MANIITKTVKKTARKTTRKAVKSTVNYAKGWALKGVICWALAAGIAWLKTAGVELPVWATGADTVSMVAFIIVGFLCFGRKLSAGRMIALVRTFLK